MVPVVPRGLRGEGNDELRGGFRTLLNGHDACGTRGVRGRKG